MNGTKAARALQTRCKLEQVARKLFPARGFAKVSAEEVVAAVDVTRGALYHHYDGKEELFAAVVDALMQEVHAKLARSAAVASDPLQAIKRGIGAFLTVCAEPSVQRILLVDAPVVLGWPKWREMDATYGFGLLKQALAGAMQTGLVRKQDLDVLTHILLGARSPAGARQWRWHWESTGLGTGTASGKWWPRWVRSRTDEVIEWTGHSRTNS